MRKKKESKKGGKTSLRERDVARDRFERVGACGSQYMKYSFARFKRRREEGDS